MYDFFRKSDSLSMLYLVFSLTLGLIMLFLTPPFQVPDEGYHYYKTISVAKGDLLCNGNVVLAPKNYVTLPDDTKFIMKAGGQQYSLVDVRKIEQALNEPASKKTKSVSDVVTCNALPIGYIPQSLGLATGLLFNAPPLISFYLGRIFALISAIFIIYLAIRIAPFGKIIFLIVGLLPMTIQQIASFSYDAMHISLILLFVAYTLKISCDSSRVSKKQLYSLVLLSFIAFNAKPGYFPLSLLVFILPMNKFLNARKYWLYTIGFVAANLLLFGLVRLIFNESGEFSKGVNPNLQIWQVLNNPLNFLVLVVESIYVNWNFYYETFLLKPGWMNTGLPSILYIIMGGAGILFLRSCTEENLLSVRQRILLFGIFCTQTIFVFLSMYLVWTPIGANHIDGVQGRYFLAIFPLLVLSIYKSKFVFRSKLVGDNLVFFLGLFLMLSFCVVFLSIYDLYYID